MMIKRVIIMMMMMMMMLVIMLRAMVMMLVTMLMKISLRPLAGGRRFYLGSRKGLPVKKVNMIIR